MAAYWAQARWVFKINVPLDMTPLCMAVLLSLGGALGAGLFLSRGICRRPPLNVLRQL